MKDTQLYAQILGVIDPWSVEGVELSFEENTVHIRIGFDAGYRFPCPVCGKPSSRYGLKSRKWRHLDTCQLTTTIEADVPRVNCTEHGVHLVAVPWAESGSLQTILFEAMVIRWLEVAPVSAVAERMNIDWDTAHRIQRRAVERGMQRREESAPIDVMVDETSEKKGHNYLTIVSEGSTVLYVGQGRDSETLDDYWQTLSDSAREGVRSVSMDLWQAFRSSTLKNLPGAQEKICLDRFHAAGYFGEAVNKVRKQEHRELLPIGDDRLKGTKFDWLKTSANIDNRSRLDFMKLAKSALKTARAWAIKETANGLWHYSYIGAAEREWNKLLNWMTRSRLEPVVKLAKSIRKHLWMILNAIRLEVNNGCAEGNNSRIQKIKKMACGFRNTENFKTAIYFHLGNLDMMPSFLPTR